MSPWIGVITLAIVEPENIKLSDWRNISAHLKYIGHWADSSKFESENN